MNAAFRPARCSISQAAAPPIDRRSAQRGGCVQRRVHGVPRGRLLESMTEPQEVSLTARTADELESDWNALEAHATRDDQRRVARQVERGGENRPSASVGLGFG